MYPAVRIVSAFATVALVAGCAEFSTVFRTTNLDEGASVVTDAQQRIVTNTKASVNENSPGINVPDRIVCLEPSPDVAQIFSNALSIVAKAGPATGPSGSAGLSSAVSLGQLVERLATIQLLRDELSHLCRAYANGSVSTTTYTLRLNRLDKKMVTLLMAEMSAGAFGRELTSLSSASSAQPGRQADQAALDKAYKDVQDARTDMEGKRAAYDAAVKANGAAAATTEKAAYDAALGDFNTKNALLFEQMTVHAAAAATANARGTPGSIPGRSDTNRHLIAAEITGLQRNYLDEDDLGILLSACISATDRLIISQRNKDEATELKAVEGKLTAARTNITQKRGDLRLIRDEFDILQAKLTSLNKQQEAIVSKLEVQSQFQLDDTELNKAEEARRKASREAETAYYNYRTLDERIEVLKGRAETLASLKEPTPNQLAELKDARSKLESLNATFAQFDSARTSTRDAFLNAERHFRRLLEERNNQASKLEGQIENLQEQLKALRDQRTAVEADMAAKRKELLSAETELEKSIAEETSLNEKAERLSPFSATEQSNFAKWCEKNMEGIQDQIRTQHVTQVALREMELRIGQRSAGMRFCHDVLKQGDNASDSAKSFCDSFLGMGAGLPNSGYRSILIDLLKPSAPQMPANPPQPVQTTSAQ